MKNDGVIIYLMHVFGSRVSEAATKGWSAKLAFFKLFGKCSRKKFTFSETALHLQLLKI